jgi:chorismate mutase
MKNLENPISYLTNKDPQLPTIIAGPCSAESKEQVMATADAILSKGKAHIFRAGIWKPRTRPNSFEGIGEKGLPWLAEVKKKYNIPVSTEVAKTSHIEAALKHNIDLLWIGARTTASPFAMQEIADALRGVDIPVLVKNPVNAELALWIGGMERLNQAGIKKIGAIHRGFSGIENTIYRNLPMWHLAMELKRIHPEIPVICDPSHICGKREPIAQVAQHAVDLNLDGLMIETHINPDVALSDSGQQLTPESLDSLLSNLVTKKEYSTKAQFEQKLEYLRAKIDRLDDELVELLKGRGEISIEIGNLKQTEQVTVFQQGRLDELLELRKKSAQKKGVNPEMIEDIFKRIHTESVELQCNLQHKKEE